MKDNPQINRFYTIGIRRFANRGIDGIKIQEICDELKISKSSFYHYFGSKNGFVEMLFDYWFKITHEDVSKAVDHIDDPSERFLVLKRIIDANEEVEYCFLQMKLYATTNIKAREIIRKAHKVRFGVLFKIFKMSGQSDAMAEENAKKMILLYYGRVALKHGYSSSSEDLDIDDDHFLKFFDLEKLV